jgi:hypothetical protein
LDPLDRASRKHGKLLVTVFQAVENGPFGLDFNPQSGATWDGTFASVEQAKTAADLRLVQQGHVCGVHAWNKDEAATLAMRELRERIGDDPARAAWPYGVERAR